MIITIDFETWDPYLKELGSGWAHGNITILGASIKIDDGDTKYYRNKRDILQIAKQADTIIAHNLQYDVGILMMMGLDIKDKTLIDTLVLSVLNDNTEDSYSLNHLAKKYLNTEKKQDIFAEVVFEHKLYKTTTGKSVNVSCPKKLMSYAMANLHEVENVRPDVVEEYCNHDVEMCYGLYTLFKQHVRKKESDILKILLKSRQRGVRLDVPRLKEISKQLKELENKAREKAEKIAGYEDFNINSSEHLSQVYNTLGIKYPMTAPTEKFPQGQPSIRAEWVKSNTDEFSKAIAEYKHVIKARRDFCDKPLKHQKLLPEDKRGRVYPEFNLYGARATGRFTCRNPNLQQLPSHDELIAPLIRGCYLPEEGQTFYHMDFSAQEPRLQVHYSYLIKAEGAAALRQEFINNPKTDLHTVVAELCNIERKQAKTVNLGISYGMGVRKLAESLSLNQQQATLLRNSYNDTAPYLKHLANYCKKTIENRGFIYTLNRRKLKNEYGTDKNTGEQYSFGYKAINKLIQGSASDQLINCMIALDEAGIDILLSEHDAISFSLKTHEEALKAKEIMETMGGDFEVPMVVDMGKGKNWAEAK